MAQSPDSLLVWYQELRHIGESVLFAGIAGELFLIVLIDWPDFPSHLLLKKQKLVAELTCTALILFGVGIENFAGGRADDAVRQMRAVRSLTDAQMVGIATKLRPFAGQQIDVLSYRGDVEAWWLADKIRIALGGGIKPVGSNEKTPSWNGAGWIVHWGTVSEYNRAFSGITVETTETADIKAREAKKELVSALSTEGVLVIDGGTISNSLKMDAFGDMKGDEPDTSYCRQ